MTTNRFKLSAILACALMLSMFAAACSSSDGDDSSGSQQDTASLIDQVRERDQLICGTRDDLTGFASKNAEGEFVGFDVEFCKVIAAGILGDATKVDFRALGPERFTAVQSGEVDILFRNATATASRDGREGLSFPFTTVYDGQRMIVPADSDIMSLEDMDGASICVVQGTTTELNLNAVLGARGIAFNPEVYNSHTELREAYQAGL